MTGLQTYLILGLLAYFSRGLWSGLFQDVVRTSKAAIVTPNANSLLGVSVSHNTPAPGAFALGGPAPTATPYALNIIVNMMTPTLAPGAVTPTFEPDVYTVDYSYYNPNMGGVNCHSANWDGRRCADVTASGFKWSEYLQRAVAFPVPYLRVAGYGTVIRVLSPSPLVGDYTVIDMCCGCGVGNKSTGHYWIDFLSDHQQLEWSAPVTFQIKARMDGVSDPKRLDCSGGG